MIEIVEQTVKGIIDPKGIYFLGMIHITMYLVGLNVKRSINYHLILTLIILIKVVQHPDIVI